MRSVLIAQHWVEGICCRSFPWKVRRSWRRETLISLGDLSAAQWRAAADAWARTRGGEPIPASLQTHGQSPLPPARKNTAADGARGGSSRRVEGGLGCYILEVLTGTCHRSPAGGDGLD